MILALSVIHVQGVQNLQLQQDEQTVKILGMGHRGSGRRIFPEVELLLAWSRHFSWVKGSLRSIHSDVLMSVISLVCSYDKANAESLPPANTWCNCLYLNNGCVAIFLHISDDLDCNIALVFPVPALENSAKRACMTFQCLQYGRQM